MEVNNFAQLFEWGYQHMMLVGWPAIFWASWKASKWFTQATTTVDKAVTQIDKMSEDHFPAMKESLRTQDTVLKSVDESLKTLVQSNMQFSAARPVRRKRRK